MATPEEIAWAAGLFEGEGCITMTSGHAVLRLSNTDEWVVRRFAEIVGRGVVYGPYENRSNDHFVRKPFFVWVLQ